MRCCGSSPARQGDLAPVFQAILTNATRICAANFGNLYLIADVIKTIEPLAAKNANQVVAKCDGAAGTMHADQMRLRQALLNPGLNVRIWRSRAWGRSDGAISSSK